MKERALSYTSEGSPVHGLLRLPDSAAEPVPCIVQGPAWLGVKEGPRNVPYHRALTDAGFAVFVFDARGFGESAVVPRELNPDRQVVDLINAVSFVASLAEIDRDRIGTFGTGATGGSNAIVAAAWDDRIKAVVSQVPIADGADWLHRMRSEEEWIEFRRRVSADAERRARGEPGEMVAARGDIVPVAPERREAERRGLVAPRDVPMVALAGAEAILRYRPIDSVSRVARLLVVAVEDDPITPTDHALSLFQAAREPKRLILQRDTSHHEAYTKYQSTVIPEIVSWFERYLGPDDHTLVLDARSARRGPGEVRP